MVMMGDQLVHA